MIRYFLLLLTGLVAASGTLLTARAADLGDSPAANIVLFYPAQLSWEMLLTQGEHSGADKFRDGKNCRQCHGGEEQASGMLLVADPASEPSPIRGKPGSVPASLRATIDGNDLVIQVAFDPGAQPDAGMDPDFPTKIAVMFGDDTVPEFPRGGCWATCHDNLAKMPSGGDRDTTKYLSRSREKLSRQGGTEIKSDADIQKLRDAGGFLEYWQAKLADDRAPVAISGWILDKRREFEDSSVSAEAMRDGSLWIVTFRRALTGVPGHKDIVPGQTYTFGVSLHAGNTAKRFHYVSLEHTMSFAGDSDLVLRRD